jgi:hypothetical protein
VDALLPRLHFLDQHHDSALEKGVVLFVLLGLDLLADELGLVLRKAELVELLY